MPNQLTPDDARSDLPPAEVQIDDGVVGELLRAQFPQWSHLAIEHFASGWDNVTYRLGETMAVRLPRIAVARDLLLKEQQFLPSLASQFEVQVPVPLGLGVPSGVYPWPFSVVPWFPGADASHSPLLPTEAALLGSFLRTLHSTKLPGLGPLAWRGGPLQDRAADVAERLARLRRMNALPAATLRELEVVFQRFAAVEASEVHVPVHGDLHPKNLVTEHGRLRAVIDWGDLNLGDPATDLASVWLHFAPRDHAAFWEAYGAVSEAAAMRARGWALFFGLNLLVAEASGEQDFGGAGSRTLNWLLG